MCTHAQFYGVWTEKASCRRRYLSSILQEVKEQTTRLWGKSKKDEVPEAGTWLVCSRNSKEVGMALGERECRR